MNVARVSRIVAGIVAAAWLAACAARRDHATAQPVAPGRALLPGTADAEGGAGRSVSPTHTAIAPADASRYVGQTGTVCGVVVSSRYAARSKGQPTFLNLDRAWPEQVFTVVIWRRDRAKFPAAPEAYYRDRRVCVTGRIVEYRGRAQMVVTAPAQVVISETAETIPAGGR